MQACLQAIVVVHRSLLFLFHLICALQAPAHVSKIEIRIASKSMNMIPFCPTVKKYRQRQWRCEGIGQQKRQCPGSISVHWLFVFVLSCVCFFLIFLLHAHPYRSSVCTYFRLRFRVSILPCFRPSALPFFLASFRVTFPTVLFSTLPLVLTPLHADFCTCTAPPVTSSFRSFWGTHKLPFRGQTSTLPKNKPRRPPLLRKRIQKRSIIFLPYFLTNFILDWMPVSMHAHVCLCVPTCRHGLLIHPSLPTFLSCRHSSSSFRGICYVASCLA